MSHEHAHDHGRATPTPLGPLAKADPFPCCCGGACGDSTAKPQAPANLPPGKSIHVFRIEAMDCPTEERMIRKALEPMAGVNGLAFNLLGRELTVSHDLPSVDAITAAIASLGMEAVPADKSRPTGPEPSPAWMTPKLAVSLTLAVAAELLEWQGVASPWLPAACAVAAIFLSGLPVFKKGWLAVLRRDLNINALMSVAAAGAVLLGQFPEAAMVMSLFAMAEKLEAASLTRAKNAVAALLALAPQEATVIGDDGSEAVVAAGAVPIGTRVRLRPGERVALDGAVEAGRSALDQSAVTGESLPVEKGPGDQLFAGTVNQEGELLYRTTALADDSTLARITRAVVASPGKKARTERFVDRFAAVYTPAVFAVALAVAVMPPLVAGASFADWIYKGLVILVIACPCALVISTPVSMVSGLAAAARRGILVKGGLFLEQGQALTTMVLDKTGTLTTGKPSAAETFDLAGDAAANRAIAVSLAARSDHPVSKALARAGREDGVAALPVADFAALPGRGVRGVVDGVPYHLGNHRLIEELGLCGPAIEARLEALEAQGQTAALLAGPEAVLAVYAAADVIKPHSREAVAELHNLGIRTVLLSGDNSRTAGVIAGQAGIDEARGDQLPEDKAAAVDALTAQGDGSGLVGMVGDGINDAPALARADLGVAMGSGIDVAVESCDVVLMRNDLAGVPAALELSRAVIANIKQNLFWAFAFNVIGIPVAAGVLHIFGGPTLNPMIAGTAMALSSFTVVTNALRLRFFTPSPIRS